MSTDNWWKDKSHYVGIIKALLKLLKEKSNSQSQI